MIEYRQQKTVSGCTKQLPLRAYGLMCPNELRAGTFGSRIARASFQKRWKALVGFANVVYTEVEGSVCGLTSMGRQHL